jgi:steroid delta-isomerase
MRAQVVQETVDAYLQAIGNKDVDAWLACFAPGAVIHDPGADKAIRGQDEMERYFASITRPFDTLAATAVDVRSDGASAEVAFSVSGLDLGGRTVSFQGKDFMVIDSLGRIAELRSGWDPLRAKAEIARMQE